MKGTAEPPQQNAGTRAWQSSKNQSIGWLSTSNRSSDETTDYQRLITANTHFLVGSDWFPTIAIVVEKSGDFTVVGCDCLDDLTENRGGN